MKRILFLSGLFLFLATQAQTVKPIRQNDSTDFAKFLTGVKYVSIDAPRFLVEQAISRSEEPATAPIVAIRKHLLSMGFKQVVFTEYNPISSDSMMTLCELIHVKVSYEVDKKHTTRVTVRFEGCDRHVFYEFEEEEKIPLGSVEAWEIAFAEILPDKKPAYDPANRLSVSCLGSSGASETDIRNYLDSTELGQIEGIYELKDFKQTLNVAVVRSRLGYHILYLSGFGHPVDWPVGEILGRIRITSRQQFFTADWCGFNKTHYENVSCRSSGESLIFNMGSIQYNFVKTYPLKK